VSVASLGARAIGAGFGMEGVMLRVRLPVLGLVVFLPLGAGGAFAQTDGGMKDPLPPPAAAAETPDPAAPVAEPTQCPDNMEVYAGSDETLTCICPAERL
jgi:hypothetical protein